jgi:hypothetical protein
LPEKSGLVKDYSKDKFPVGRYGAKPASLCLFVGAPSNKIFYQRLFKIIF